METNKRELKKIRELMNIDNKLMELALPMEAFENDEGIYRIDYDKYVPDKVFDDFFKYKERLMYEYMYFNNHASPTLAIREMENLTDLELSALVEEQLEHEECYVYFTTAYNDEEEEKEDNFEIGEKVLYLNGNICQIGEIKSVGNNNSYYVYYHTGDTAALTNLRHLYKITNEYAFLILRKKADTTKIQETKARMLANKIIEKFEEITEKDFKGEDYYKLEDEITELINNYKGE